MPNERSILCGGVTDTALPVGGKPLRLRLWGRRPNVKLEINDISRALGGSVPAAFADLVDIATYVYCADQAITRGGDGVEELGADWRRRLFFRIPVRALDLWSDARSRSALAATLGFLSEDEYSFEFTELKDGTSFQDYLPLGGDGATSDRIEEVILFSGGLDSLAGAVHEAVVDKRRVALITHQPIQKFVRRYRKLREDLAKRAAHRPLFVPVSINKSKSLGREYTQRSRSFLYVALAAAVAQMLGLTRVRFYENGVVSLNLPPSAQVVGARATRTTHPQVLNGFAEVISLVAGRRFVVENPFLWRTKTDVVQTIVSANCADLIKYSTSCTHTWEMTNIHPHCGSCSQCIDRRFAVLAAGAADADPEEGYKVKLLVDERVKDVPRTLIASYVETARQVAQMSPSEFFSRFGEASRVLRHLDGSPDSTALKIYELLRRHAEQVTTVVRGAIASHAEDLLQRTLPPTCLLRLVCDASAAGGDVEASSNAAAKTAKPPLALARNVFKRKSEKAWLVRYGGGADFILLRSKGAAYLHILLSNAGSPLSAAKLASMVAGRPEEYMLGDADESSDREAMAAYRARAEELQEEMQQARDNNDEATKERVQREMAEIASHIQVERGLDGRLRKRGSVRERVRVAVANAIARAVKQIARDDSALAAHLRSPTLKGGQNPCYAPSPPVEWDLT